MSAADAVGHAADAAGGAADAVERFEDWLYTIRVRRPDTHTLLKVHEERVTFSCTTTTGLTMNLVGEAMCEEIAGIYKLSWTDVYYRLSPAAAR